MTRVLQTGIPLWRAYIGLQLVHPQLQAMGYMWRRGEKVQEIARAWGIQFTPAYIGSPMQAAREQGRLVRHRLTDLTEHDHVVLHELKADGGVDYIALPMRIRREGPLPVVTFATDSRMGFSDDDIADLTRLVDMMGAVTEMHIEHSVAETVANTYLGRQVGQRVLNGAIRRGEGEEIRAVLWFSDLRDFTGMNERLPAGRAARAAEQLPAARGRRAVVQRRRDPEIHRRRRDGLFPGRGCAVPAHGHGPGAGRGAPADRRHRGGQRGARRGRPRAAALRHRPACRRR